MDRRSDRDWQRLLDASTPFWTTETTNINDHTTSGVTAEKLMHTAKLFSIMFPSDKIVNRIDVDPYAYRKLQKMSHKRFSMLPDVLGGIWLNSRHDLLPGCSVQWFADGHFEVTSGFCEVHE